MEQHHYIYCNSRNLRYRNRGFRGYGDNILYFANYMRCYSDSYCYTTFSSNNRFSFRLHRINILIRRDAFRRCMDKQRYCKCDGRCNKWYSTRGINGHQFDHLYYRGRVQRYS